MTKTVRTKRAARAPYSSRDTTPAPAASALSERAFADAPAERRLQLLRLVQQSGSISQAARDAGISYKAAWQAIQRLGEQVGSPVVAASVGGAGGGGAQLSEAGKRLLQAAELVQRAQRDAIARVNAPGNAPPDAPENTIRNRLPCTVQGLMSDSASDPLVRVALTLADGSALLADITRASAEKLELAAGQRVLALCKATAVRIVAATSAAAPDGCCAIAGEVQHIAAGVRRDEVLLRCASGALLAGFATRPHTLRGGGKAYAHVDASTVAVALP
ncbi:MAG: LysR family transcriptional regulator [Ottowia sp.]|nr:LysR family transcriptional regulator [Ottowia sp.]